METQSNQSLNSEFFPLIHRDLSWLSFNERVLQEAKDKTNPLFERIKFLGIYSKNLGEFFHVRMAYHLNLIRVNKSTRKRLSYSPKKIIKQITSIVNKQQIEFTRIFNEEIRPELINHEILIKELDSLSDNQKNFIEEYFLNSVRIFVNPVLMRGKAVNPFLKDGSLYLGILMQEKNSKANNNEYGLVKIPSDKLPRFISLPTSSKSQEIILLDDIVRFGLQNLFPGFVIKAAYSFKMTRDAELYIDPNFSGSIKDAIKKSLSKRQVGIPARFVYDRNMPKELIAFLTNSFDLHKYDKIKEGRYQNFYDFIEFPSFGKLELKNNPFQKINYQPLEKNENIWSSIESADHIIHPPYHSFDSAVQFFEKAAKDEYVTDIYITQYRVGHQSKILTALIKAAKNGKNITVFVEVQARFDEQSNLEWGEKLELAGVKVIYSLPGVKVHCKIGLVKRMKNNIESSYALLSTGNFHENNSKIYSDMCLFTSEKNICSEVDTVFKFLDQSITTIPSFTHLLVGKSNLRGKLEAMIDREIEHANNGKKAYLLLKMNNLEDSQMIKKLYEASNANVKIDLIVRGICCLVPGLSKISENITAISVLDRYLEHARAYYFHNDGKGELFLSSADWMTRNLSRRIEVAFPIYDQTIKSQILEILHIQLADNIKARVIDQHSSNRYKTSLLQNVQSQEAIHFFLRKATHSISSEIECL